MFAKRKFKQRFGRAMAGILTEHEMEIALDSIKQSGATNKDELVQFLDINIRETWGPYTSPEFQSNRSAMRFYNLLQKIKDKYIDSN